jgi:hypothetical protein
VATAVARAIRNHAVTSSIAAQASVSAPTGRLSIRRSTRIRASTGNAVIDIATPMKSAKARKSLSGPTSPKIGTATATPSIIGSATLVLEIAAACEMRPFSWLASTSRPTRNM